MACCGRKRKEKNKYATNMSLVIDKDFFYLESIRSLCPQCYKEFKKIGIDRIRKNIFATAVNIQKRLEEIKKLIASDNKVEEEVAEQAAKIMERFYFSRFR